MNGIFCLMIGVLVITRGCGTARKRAHKSSITMKSSNSVIHEILERSNINEDKFDCEKFSRGSNN